MRVLRRQRRRPRTAAGGTPIYRGPSHEQRTSQRASGSARAPSRSRTPVRLPVAGWYLQPGNRNPGLWWVAWRAVQDGDNIAVAQISQAALSPGLGQPEVDRTIASALHAAGRPRGIARRENCNQKCRLITQHEQTRSSETVGRVGLEPATGGLGYNMRGHSSPR